MAFYLRTIGRLSLHPNGPDSDPVLSESKSLIILALLAVTPDHRLSREHLADLLWPDGPHRKARRSLRQSLYYLSQNAGGELVEADDGHVTLVGEGFDCDIWALDRAVQSSDREAVVESFEGRFLETLDRKLGRELSEWVDLQNQRLRSARRDAFRRLIQRNLEHGREDEAIRHARAYAARQPLNEEAQLYLIETLKQVGDEAGALQAYEEYRSLVRSAVGDEPSEELEKSVETVREVLLADREWKAIAAPEPEALTAARARRYAGWLVAAGVVVGGGAAILGMSFMDGPGPPPNSRLDVLDARLDITVSGGPVRGPAGRRDLVLDGSAARIEPTSVPRYRRGLGLPAPDGRHIAYSVSVERGIDLYLERVGAQGAPENLLGDEGDQNPLAWSPDGRQLLIGRGHLDADTYDYSETLVRYDVVEDRLFPDVRTYLNRMEPRATWSPDGTRLAITEDGGGHRDIRISTVDGADQWMLASTPAEETSPAWSPDGRRIAYISDASGSPRLMLWTAGRDGAVRVLDGPGYEDTPVWLSDRILVFVRDVDRGRDVWGLDLVTKELRQLTDCACASELDRDLMNGPSGPWIDEVRIRIPELAVPGDTLTPTVAVTWSDGRERRPAVLRWISSDTAVVLPLEDGRLAVRAPGVAHVTLSAGGWRADTVKIPSAPLVATDLRPAFEEDWSAGIRPDRWMLGGDPLPYARPEGGPEGGGVFVNNGDRHYTSGAISTQWFSTERGLTVETWGRVPTSGRLHQTLSIHLIREPGPPPGPRPLMDAILLFAVTGHTDRIQLKHAGHNVTLPRPETRADWHLYTIQLAPDGTVDLLIDGELVRRRRGLLPRETIPDSLRVGLGARSFGTEITHGTVRIYEGLKHRP